MVTRLETILKQMKIQKIFLPAVDFRVRKATTYEIWNTAGCFKI